MSYKYVHKDLEGLIQRFFDSIDENPVFTENYQECREADKINFCHACQQGNIEIVNLIIDKNIYSRNIALLWASNNDYNNIRNLIEKKDANDWNKGLEIACREGHMEIIKFVIEEGA